MGSNRKTPHVSRIWKGGQLADNRKISNKRNERLPKKGNLLLFVGEYMKYDKKKAIEIIVDAAKNYKESLQDKTFLIIYQNAETVESFQVEFRDNHFLHLTGIKTKLSAQHFYEKCINGKLAVEEIELDQNGKTQQKLLVLPFLHELLYHNCMVGSFINSGIYIRADYFVGNTKAVLSVGFRYGKKFDFPVSLYREDVRKLSHPTNKVLAIFVKSFKQKTYTECTYLSKGQEIHKLPVSNEVKKLLGMENLYSQLDKGIDDVEAGRVHTVDEAFQIVRARIKNEL